MITRELVEDSREKEKVRVYMPQRRSDSFLMPDSSSVIRILMENKDTIWKFESCIATGGMHARDCMYGADAWDA
jgi:hypothetical protein